MPRARPATAPLSIDDAPSRSMLREATLRGARAIAGARAVSEVIRFASMVGLARLISPAEFGHVAIALIATAVAQGLTADGLGSRLVQQAELRRASLETTLLLGAAIGLSLTLVTLLVVPLFSEPLFGHRTAVLIRLASPIFLVVGLGISSQASLQRRLQFRTLSRIDILATVVLAGVSLAGAAAGLEGESIILGTLAASLAVTVASVLAAPTPWPRWHREEARETGAFGVPAAVAGLTLIGYRNVDYAILGAQLPSAQVGYYWRAFQVGVEYQQKFSQIITRLALPVYSRAVDLEHRRLLRTRLGRTQATLVFPFLALIAATAPVLIPWLFGEAWRPAATPTQILAVGGMLAVLRTTTGPFILALGRPSALMLFNTAALVGYGAVVLATAPYGITAVCYGALATQAVMLLGSFTLLLGRLAGVNLLELWREAAPATVASAALVAAALPVVEVLDPAMPAGLALVGAGAAGGAAYLAVIRVLFPAAWRDLRTVWDRLRPTRSGRVAEAVPTRG